MSVVIESVHPGSPAEKAGIKAGDLLLSINGNTIEDVLDYRFHMTNSRLVLQVQSPGLPPAAKSLAKEQYQDLGLEFGTYLMDKQRRCKNKCVFCFIDQLPEGMRESLYFKDDDSRMSFLFGNYITLTNLRQKDVDRILAMHISPVNISVHTTNPDLRVKMMGNPQAGKVLDHIPRLVEGGVKVNTQLVLCAGVNDGPELDRTLADLCALAPGIQSVAVVPLGVTRYRQGLAELRPFTAGECGQVIDTVDRFGQQMLDRHGQRICYAADEFYLGAGRSIPAPAYYGEYPQLENGVGMLALLEDEFAQALELEPPQPVQRALTLATGTAAAPFLTGMARRAGERFPGLDIHVVPVPNNFFGDTITVAGLVTGSDLLACLSLLGLGQELLLPASMLRHEGDLFLDDVSLDELSHRLNVPVRTVPDDGFALLDAMLGM